MSGSTAVVLEWKNHGARGPAPSKIGALFHEAVDYDAVAVDGGVLVVQGIDKSLGEVEQPLLSARRQGRAVARDS